MGYRIRFEKKVSRRTRIEVVTEGILTRMLVEDPTLEGVSVLIFDEFHERSLQTDLALALAREAQDVLRPDLKLVLMSATIDVQALCAVLDAQAVSCEGKMFPVENRYMGDTPVEDIVEATFRMIRSAHKEQEGDILAFLAGGRRDPPLRGSAGKLTWSDASLSALWFAFHGGAAPRHCAEPSRSAEGGVGNAHRGDFSDHRGSACRGGCRLLSQARLRRPDGAGAS